MNRTNFLEILYFLFSQSNILKSFPQDIEILKYCLTSQEDAFLAVVGHPSSDGVTIKIPYRVDDLLHRPASHPTFSYWVG